MKSEQDEPAVLGPVQRQVRPLALPFAVFDEFGKGADDRVQDWAASLLADNALLKATEQQLRKLLEGADRRAIAHGKKREELAAQAADVAGERAANAALTAENERLRTPLTKEQIERALQFKPARADANYLYATAREIERAHGICVA